ncbi:hypothetical protein KC340_g5793 [Hortaea werneckii]|nr:hypothetical protein KC342_g6082 [Hortaea werneckii]KAI7326726.1 hypothetical protein KC340_g5793 [Hortaea werneckii]KAI7398224.1 hypothetical protein KC328_g4555 [Hortaea werneckii]
MNQSPYSVETQAPVTYREHLEQSSNQDETSDCQVEHQQSDEVTNLSIVSRPTKDVAKPKQDDRDSWPLSKSVCEPPEVASRDTREDLFSLFTNDTDTVEIDCAPISIVEEPLYMHPDAAWNCLIRKGQAFMDQNGNIVALQDLDFHQQVAWLSMMTRGQLWIPDDVTKRMATGESVAAEHDRKEDVVRGSPVWQQLQATMTRAGEGQVPFAFEGFCEEKQGISRSTVSSPTRKNLTDPLTPAKTSSTNALQPVQFAALPPHALMIPKALVVPKVLPISGKKVYRIKYLSTRAHLNPLNNRKSLANLVLESLLSQGRAVLVEDAIFAGGGNTRSQTVRTVVDSVCCYKLQTNPLQRDDDWHLFEEVRDRIEILRTELGGGQVLEYSRFWEEEYGEVEDEWRQFDEGGEGKEKDI